MKRKYVNIALGVFLAIVILLAVIGAAGIDVSVLSKIAIICAMILLVINSLYDIKEGKDKVFCIIIIVIAVLAIITNIASIVMGIMGIQ